MHAIGSGIMSDSEYLHETSALNTTSQCIYNCDQTQIRYRYLANMFCITIIKKLNNERLGKIASTGVRL